MARDGSVHLRQGHTLSAASIEQPLQLTDIDCCRLDQHFSSTIDDEIDEISRFQSEELPNSLGNRHLAFAGYGRAQYFLTFLVIPYPK